MRCCLDTDIDPKSLLGSDDDFRKGYQNVTHHHREESLSGLPSLGRSEYPVDCYSWDETLYFEYEYMKTGAFSY